MEGFVPLRPGGGGADLPPPPQQQQQQHQTPPYWYPPPPPPPPASSSSPHPHHPPPPYSLPPYHHYPPPHPHNHQWPPPSYAPQSQPPPYAPAPPHPYPPGPPHHMPPRPPQQMAPYPPPNQAWPNQPPAPYEGQHYPGASLPQNDGEDWAAKAKAWAAATTTGAHNGIPVDHNYLQQNGETPLDYSQKINAGGGVAVPGAGADLAPLVSPVKNYDSFSAVYEQEVPSYSSSQGSKDKLPRYDNTQDHPPFAVPPAPDRYYHQQPDPSYMVNYGHDPGPAPHLWGPPASVGPYPPPNLPPHPAQQYDIPTAVHPSMPVPNYGPPNIPPAAFNAPPVASHLNTELYHGDPLALNQINKSKKAAVPSWLREEILKKKTTIGSNSSAQVGSDGGDKSPDETDQTDSKSVDSTKIAEEEDDEDEVEAARTVAINQEIKRILTEVLLKVTDNLFEEIATKVLSEDDDMAGEGTSEPTSLVKSKSHSSAPSTSGNAKIQDKGANGSASIGKAVVPDESTKGGGGVLLGLSDYDTDDDGDDENASTDRIKQNLEPETNNSSALVKNDLLSGQNQRELDLKREDAEVPSHSEGIVNMEFEEEEAQAKEELHVEVETDQGTNGDILRDRFVDGDGNDNIEKSKVMIDSEDGFKDKREENKEGSSGGLRDEEEKNKEGGRGGLTEKEEKSKEGRRGGLTEREEKNKEEKDEMMNGNILTDKRRRSREDDRETERKDDKENKLGDLKGSKREISKEEKDKTTERDDQKDKREKSNEERERKTERRDDKEDSSKDRRERSREEKEKRAERRDDKEDSSKERRERSREEKERRAERSSRGKSDKSKEEREREMNKRDDKERSRHSKRSPSPRDRRSRSKEHSDSTKRRRTESNKRSMSRSPTRSRHRRDSRSPHSKHSHRRNSAYSTSDRRRSRSRTPTRRRRSRSRTPSRRR